MTHHRRDATAFVVASLLVAACGESRHMPAPVSPAFAVADSLRMEGRAAAAAPRYVALSDSFASVHDTASWWRGQLWLSQELLTQGRRDSGLVALALASTLAGADPNRIGWTRYVRSIFLDQVGHLDSALAETAAARALALESHDLELGAAAYHAMGRIHSLSGRYREALASNQKSFELDHQFGANARQIALELSELGIDYRHLGRFTDAVTAYDSALKVERMLQSPEGIARVEYNLANVRMATGDAGDALTLLTDALARAGPIGDVRGMAFIHGGLADLYLRANAFQPAREHFERALAINRAARLRYGEVQNLEGIGRIELAEGRAAAAIPILRSALAIADSADYGKERATSRAALARASAATGARAAASRWADQAVRIADSLGDPAVRVEARAARGVALEASDDRRAPAAFVSAIDLLESWRGRLALGDLRMGIADSHLDVYEGAIRTLLAAGRTADAFQIAERARARLLLELMAEHDVHDGDGSRTSEGHIRLALREKFATRSAASNREGIDIDRAIDSLTRALDSIEASARARDAQAGVQYPAPATVAQLRDGLLPPGRALAVYFWGEHDVYGWWVTRDAIHARRLGSADSLSALLDFMRGALVGSRGAPEWRPSARQAYDRFVAPLAPASAGEILVVADGPLVYVPLEAFMPADGGLPWGATTEFRYGPSASVLLALSRARAATSPARGVLAIGDPTNTSGGDARAGSVNPRSGEGALPDLPAAADEARGVVKLMGGDALTGDQATLAHWSSLDPGRYRYLHFATHALLDDEHPQRSALLLAGGRLDLQGIRRLRLSSELVTLSACETGLGQRVRGEGIIGLPHAFLEAGAHAVIVSLWRVHDQAAARYIADFYGELHAGHSPAEAMLAVRQARLREAGAASQPSQWAAFVLIGAGSDAPAGRLAAGH